MYDRNVAHTKTLVILTHFDGYILSSYKEDNLRKSRDMDRYERSLISEENSKPVKDNFAMRERYNTTNDPTCYFLHICVTYHSQ